MASLSITRNHRAVALGALAVGAAVLLVAGPCAGAPSAYDLVFHDARVVDGTGRPAFTADVAVRGDTIVKVSRSRAPLRGRRVVDAHGRVLTPGFVDSHAHGDPLDSDMENSVSQGVTLIVLGQDGRTPGSSDDDGGTSGRTFAQWQAAVEQKGLQLNVATLAGFGTIRNDAGIGTSTPVTAAQQARMRELLKRDLDEGAFGMSTGLEYVPDRFSSTGELVDLAKVVGADDGVIESHMRSEDDDKIEGAINELIAQGKYARVHISHIKVVMGHGAARGEAVLDQMREANAHGVRLSADVYTYTAGSADFSLIYPDWAKRRSDWDAAVRDQRARLEADIATKVNGRNGPGAILIENGPDAGLTVEQAAKKAGKPFPAYIVDAGYGGPDAAHFVMDDALQETFIKSPLVAFSSDGSPTMRHPRSWGSYARLIEEFVEKRNDLTLEAAVHKATSYPTQTILGIKDRGEIAPGMKADLVLFDPKRVKTRSTWLAPFNVADGFDIVVVNGKVAWEHAAMTGAGSGRLLRREAGPAHRSGD